MTAWVSEVNGVLDIIGHDALLKLFKCVLKVHVSFHKVVVHCAFVFCLQFVCVISELVQSAGTAGAES